MEGEEKKYTTPEMAKLVNRKTTRWIRTAIKRGKIKAEKVTLAKPRGAQESEYLIPESEIKKYLVRRLVKLLKKVATQDHKSIPEFDTNTPLCPCCNKPSGYVGGGICKRCYKKRLKVRGL